VTDLMKRVHLAKVIGNGERFQVLKLDNGLTITLADHLRVKDARIDDEVEVVYTAPSQTSSGSGFYYGVGVARGVKR